MMNYYLQHHGIKGQRWGVRRYQNKDGTYTNAGKERKRYHLYEMTTDDKTRIASRGIQGAVSGVAAVLLLPVVMDKTLGKEAGDAFRSNMTIGKAAAFGFLNGSVGGLRAYKKHGEVGKTVVDKAVEVAYYRKKKR